MSLPSWMERAQHDASLRAFINAEIARAVVELAAVRVVVTQQHDEILRLKDKLRDYETTDQRRKKVVR